MSNGTGPESHFVGPCLPKETEYDDGDGKRDERHAVANGVAHFDGTEEFSLRKKNKKKKQEKRKAHLVKRHENSLSEHTAAAAATWAPGGVS